MGGHRACAERTRAGRACSLALISLLFVAAGCGSDKGSTTTASTATTSRIDTTGTAAASPTLASTLVFGSGSECPHEPYCLPGLESTYGLRFRSFVVTDAGGQKTVDGLKDGSIQVGVLFTTDPAVASNGMVLLEDDKHLQPAENVTPVLGYLDPNANESSDSAQAHAALVTQLAGTGLVALDGAPAQDKNGIAVTQATADRHHLTKVSELGQPTG